MKIIVSSAVALMSLFAAQAGAREHKAMADVNVTQLTQELQVMANDDGMHFIWWVPAEFWAASAAHEDMTKEEREYMLNIMSKYSLVAVAQADISDFARATFYDRAAILKGMKIELNQGGKVQVLAPIEDYPQELRMLLGMMTPALSSMLGEMGKNLQFFVLADVGKDGRVVSPYDAGSITFTLRKKQGALPPMKIEMPIDALFVQRLCPNGKPAHVSWVVCPWDGSKLPD